jgi:adenine-specific DNA-methyltransferase
MLSDNRITFGKSGTGRPMQKKFLTEVKAGITPQTWWSREFAGDTKTARYEMKELIPENVFDTPKPSSLMERLIQISNLNNSDIVLDFFAGSSSMAHGVISTNQKEGRKLSYILVQIPEMVKMNSTAHRAGYNTITDIGKERIRRAATKIREETGANIDYGFKVYRVDESNMADVYYQPQTLDQGDMDMFASNIKVDRTSEDLLTQVLLDWGLPLTLKTEKTTIEGKEVFKVAGDSLYACFDGGLDEAFAKAVAVERPLRLVVKDSAFASDTAKVNVQQLLKQLSPNTELKVL